MEQEATELAVNCHMAYDEASHLLRIAGCRQYIA
jgi:hypothetical protein